MALHGLSLREDVLVLGNRMRHLSRTLDQEHPELTTAIAAFSRAKILYENSRPEPKLRRLVCHCEAFDRYRERVIAMSIAFAELERRGTGPLSGVCPDGEDEMHLGVPDEIDEQAEEQLEREFAAAMRIRAQTMEAAGDLDYDDDSSSDEDEGPQFKNNDINIDIDDSADMDNDSDSSDDSWMTSETSCTEPCTCEPSPAPSTSPKAPQREDDLPGNGAAVQECKCSDAGAATDSPLSLHHRSARPTSSSSPAAARVASDGACHAKRNTDDSRITSISGTGASAIACRYCQPFYSHHHHHHHEQEYSHSTAFDSDVDDEDDDEDYDDDDEDYDSDYEELTAEMQKLVVAVPWEAQ